MCRVGLFAASAASIEFASETDRGRRTDNQDQVAVSPRWAVVSDGVGGHPGGHIASRLAVDAAVAQLEREQSERGLRRAFVSAAAAVREGRRSRPGFDTMDATLTVALATRVRRRTSRWLVGWVGDSPAWRAGGRGLTPLTSPHTLEATLVRCSGRPPTGGPAWGRNVLVRTVASAGHAGVDLVETALEPGDGLILASDGLIEGIGPDEIHRVWQAVPLAEARAHQLVQAALAAGASDNVTVAVLRHCGR